MPKKIFYELPKEKQNLIKQSFINLLKTKPIDKITFNSLASEAGIARTSLYVYFEDKKDLNDFVFYDFAKFLEVRINEMENGKLDLFYYARTVLNIFQEAIIKFEYNEIIKNIALGLKITPVDGYEFFDGVINNVKNKFISKYDDSVIEVVLILLKYSICALFADFNNNHRIVEKFNSQIDKIEKL